MTENRNASSATGVPMVAPAAFSYETLTDVTYGPDRFITIAWEDFTIA